MGCGGLKDEIERTNKLIASAEVTQDNGVTLTYGAAGDDCILTATFGQDGDLQYAVTGGKDEALCRQGAGLPAAPST